MDKYKRICKACGETNVRYKGWRTLFNPAHAESCTLCHADLETGERDAYGYVHYAMMLAFFYIFHAFVTTLAGLILAAGACILTEGTIKDEHFSAIVYLSFFAGLWWAEMCRRKKRLLTNRARNKGPRTSAAPES